ncbi:CPBP family glutamic-type intramembrane protease [Paenibacillus sp. 2TAB23]|uniref:CPBP family glutamic-type intramembrane protease n=1 Tax=Paenibacillus sp. 2TAB23 TaxID=3233004 RepID=UPI003F973F46
MDESAWPIERERILAMKIIFGIMGFLIIDLYMNLIPQLFDLRQAMPWLLYASLFFVLVHWVAKLTGLRGLGELGLTGHYGWKRNVRIGFLLGASAWAAMFGFLSLSEALHIEGLRGAPSAAAFLLKAFAVAFLGSLMNELVVRGYVFAHLKGKLGNGYLLLLAACLYALDDIWLSGFRASQVLASIMLGLSLGFVLLRTNSIWMSAGIYTGVSFVSSLLYGIPGHSDGKGLLVVADAGPGNLIDHAQSYTALMLLFIIMLAFRRLRMNKAAIERL